MGPGVGCGDGSEAQTLIDQDGGLTKVRAFHLLFIGEGQFGSATGPAIGRASGEELRLPDFQ